jgi:hypothetical protein
LKVCGCARAAGRRANTRVARAAEVITNTKEEKQKSAGRHGWGEKGECMSNKSLVLLYLHPRFQPNMPPSTIGYVGKDLTRFA